MPHETLDYSPKPEKPDTSQLRYILPLPARVITFSIFMAASVWCMARFFNAWEQRAFVPLGFFASAWFCCLLVCIVSGSKTTLGINSRRRKKAE
jgi:hypothetical protein